MPEFSVQITQPVAQINVASRQDCEVVEIDVARNDEADRQREMEHFDNVELTLKKIESQLTKTNEELSSIRNQVIEIVTQFAETLARTLFTKDIELVERRLNTSIEAGLSQFDPSSATVVWVNGTCLTSIQQQISNRDSEPIEICEDPLLLPGDCRIENGNDGIIARLENQLQSARNSVLLKFRESLHEC